MTDHALAGIAGITDVDAEHARQDELLRRLDEENLVPANAFPALVDTLAHLRELPDHLAWFATRYLQACVCKGHKMFPGVTQPRLGVPTSEVVAFIRCACGGDAPVEHRRTWRADRLCEVATCPDCLRDVARWDGEPYPHRTLYSPGLS